MIVAQSERVSVLGRGGYVQDKYVGLGALLILVGILHERVCLVGADDGKDDENVVWPPGEVKKNMFCGHQLTRVKYGSQSWKLSTNTGTHYL